jgi:phosphate uptake regulator
MRRKLVKQGAATLMVSLPAKWLQRNNLSKGSEVGIDEVEDSVVISAAGPEVKKEIEIKLVNLVESSIRTLITNTYRRGFDRIKVHYETEDQFNILKDVIKTRLIGFDVIKKGVNFCVVENITEPSPDQFENLLHKIFYNIGELFEATKKRMNGDGSNDFKEIEERIQKYDNFCRRVISKKKLSNLKSEFLWTFLALLIHGQREVYHLNKLLGKVKLSDSTKKFLDDSQEMFEMIKKAYLEKNISILAKVHKREKELVYTKGYTLLHKAKGRESSIIYHIILSIREFYQSNSPLSGLIM